LDLHEHNKQKHKQMLHNLILYSYYASSFVLCASLVIEMASEITSELPVDEMKHKLGHDD
jgi:hypothetical protein